MPSQLRGIREDEQSRMEPGRARTALDCSHVNTAPGKSRLSTLSRAAERGRRRRCSACPGRRIAAASVPLSGSDERSSCRSDDRTGGPAEPAQSSRQHRTNHVVVRTPCPRLIAVIRWPMPLRLCGTDRGVPGHREPAIRRISRRWRGFRLRYSVLGVEPRQELVDDHA